MDLGRAFSYVFDDDEWVKKILIGGLISMIPVIGTFVVYGYLIEIARRTFEAPDMGELPEWDDFGGYLSSGFMFWLGLLIWIVPIILIFGCAASLVVLLGFASGEEVFIGLSVAFVYLVILPAILLLSLAAALVVPVLLGRFAVHRRLGSMFEFNEIITDVRRIGPVPLLLVVVTYLVAGAFGQIGIFLCFIGVVFTSFFGQLAIGHASGQVYRLARGAPMPEPPGEPTTSFE